MTRCARIALAAVIASLLLLQILLSASPGWTGQQSADFEWIKPTVANATDNRAPDVTASATLFGLNITLLARRPQSTIHCVGENFLNSSWAHTSCHVTQLCLSSHDFVLVDPPSWNHMTFQSNYVRRATDPHQAVSTSSLKPALLRQKTYKWFPKVIEGAATQGDWYQLPSDTLWIPLDFSQAPESMPLARLLFDYVLPIYNLVAMFDLQDKRLLLTTTVPNVTLIEDLAFWLPTVTLAPGTQDNLPDNAIVCSQHAVFGIGALTDHGIKQGHGERLTDYQSAHNVGRGPLFWKLRKYILKHALGEAQHDRPKDPPYQLLHVSSSVEPQPLIASLVQSLSRSNDINVTQWDPYRQSMDKTLSVVSGSQFYVSLAGESAVPALFLPRGATLALLFDETDTIPGKKRPIFRDWDVWNHMSHLRVHWLPQNSQTAVVLEQVLRTELEYLAVSRQPETATPAICGLFQDLPLRDSRQPPQSYMHCLGDNFVPYTSFLYRSCEIRGMCLDLNSTKFTVFPSEEQGALDRMMAYRKQEHGVVSTISKAGVLEGRNARLVRNETPWFLHVAKAAEHESTLEISPDVVWIPFRGEPENMKNPGHLLWDFFLPLYKLISMYGWENKRLLLTLLDDACLQSLTCKRMLDKFLPLMGQQTIHSVSELKSTIGSLNTSRTICSRSAAMGIGMLTDHGFSRHGQNWEDYARLHNAGHGAILWEFRIFMLQNMALSNVDGHESARRRIVFSINSSNKVTRRRDFAAQIEKVRASFPDGQVEVQAVNMADLSLNEQIRLALQTSVFITVVGGSSAIASFLPRESNLVLYFDDLDDFVGRSKRSDFPAMMDFDLWNSASYLKVHWLPISTMDTDNDLDALTLLVKQELDSIDRLHARYL